MKKYINGFNDLYSIDENGTVYSNNYNHVLSPHKEITLKARKDINGYPVVALQCDCKKVLLRIHRIIAQAFISNPENKPQINHINGNKLDYRIENLEWVTDSENKQHSFDTGLRSNEKQRKPVLQINKNTNEVINEFESIQNAGKIIGIDYSNISKCCRNIQKTTGGFKWKFK